MSRNLKSIARRKNQIISRNNFIKVENLLVIVLRCNVIFFSFATAHLSVILLNFYKKYK